LFDERGAVRGCVGVFVDITEHKRTQDALREASRRKDEFLAILAHELRNPLAALAAAAQLLAKAPERPAVATTARDAVQRQIDHMSHLLDDLLDVSRITHGLVQLRVEHVNLVEAMEAAVETARTQIAARSHSLRVSAPREPVYVHGDRVRLTQIAWNLLSNAAKYTDAGGVIEVIVRAEADAAILIVRDNGIGIAPEMLGRVFEMFSQATPALHRSEGGLGIGLSLVRGLVRLHGGDVEARSAGPRQGSEFIVRLPLVRPSKDAARDASFAARRKEPGRALRILVADDNADSATSWAMLLQLAGHDVRVAHDGREALALAEQLRPHLALLDIGMPGVNGYEVARAIRAAPWGAGMTLVAITGWGQEHDKAEARAAGFDHHYTKPVELSTLDPLLADLAARSP
jgi:CheY-like chemotaxis protein